MIAIIATEGEGAVEVSEPTKKEEVPSVEEQVEVLETEVKEIAASLNGASGVSIFTADGLNDQQKSVLVNMKINGEIK